MPALEKKRMQHYFVQGDDDNNKITGFGLNNKNNFANLFYYKQH